MPDVNVDILAKMEGADKVTRDLDKLNKEGEELHKTFSAELLDAGIGRLSGEIQDSTNQVKRLGNAIEDIASSQLAKDAERVETALEGANSAAGKLGRSVLNAQAPLNDIAPDKKSPSGGGGFRTESAGQVLSGLSQVTGLGQLQVGADLVGLAGDSQEAIAGLREMGVALAPLGVAAAGVAAAFAVVGLAMSGTAKDIQKVIDASKRQESVLNAVRAAQNLTADDLVSSIKEQEAAMGDLTRVRDDFLTGAASEVGKIDSAFDAIGTSADAIADVLGVGGAIETAKDQAEEYNKRLAEQAEVLERLNAISEERSKSSDVEKQMRLENELADLRENATAEEIQDRIDKANQDRAIQETLLGFAEARLKDLQALNEKIKAATGSIPEEQLVREKELQSQIENNTASLGLLNTELNGLYGILPSVIVAEREEVRQLERIADMTERLNDIRKQEEMRLAQTQKDFTQSSNQRDAAEQKLLATESQLAALESDRAKQMERQAQQDALAASQDAREGALQAQIDAARTNEAMRDIQQDASQKLIDIVKQTNEDILSAQVDYQKSVDKLNADWMRSEIRAIQDFNLQQKRLREDTQSDLLQAALDNDVNAFLEARNSAVTQLARNDEDFSLERQRSKEDRDLQIQEMQITFQEQQAERRRQAEISLQQTRAEASQRLQMEADAANGRLTQVQALEQQMLSLRERFGQENKALQDRFNQEDYNARVQALNETLVVNRNNFDALVKQTANLALAVGRAAAQGFFAGAQGTVDASIQVAINQAFVEDGG